MHCASESLIHFRPTLNEYIFQSVWSNYITFPPQYFRYTKSQIPKLLVHEFDFSSFLDYCQIHWSFEWILATKLDWPFMGYEVVIGYNIFTHEVLNFLVLKSHILQMNLIIQYQDKVFMNVMVQRLCNLFLGHYMKSSSLLHS